MAGIRQRQWGTSSSHRSGGHILHLCSPLLLENCVHTRHPYQRLYHTVKHISPERLNPKSLHKNKTIDATQAKQSKQTTEPVLPHIKWNTDSIELNGKIHKLPITKEYMLREYHDVFKGIGTHPGGPYHIRLKEQYRPVQHPPRSVPVAMQTAYKAELDRLMREGIITEVKEQHRVDQLYSTCHEAQWQSKTVPRSQRLKQSD